MKKTIAALAICLPMLCLGQPADRRAPYDLTKGRTLYTVGYTHLDTQWNWDYPTTIDQYIKRTMTGNFALFEKYPDYIFTFTGSRRYAMMKEYYPALYDKMKEYMAAGRWFAGSACVDEGEVNISSSESMIRQVLYGNLFYEREFGRRAADYMLPDCFGFVATVPSALAHAGVLGFSTQKLTWKSATPIPFNVGLWAGPDGGSVIAALNATKYAGRVPERLDRDSMWVARLDGDVKKYGLHFDYRYYGIGDRGGAPREDDVKNAIGSLKNKDSKINVVLTPSDQMFRDVTPAIRKKMPVYSGDLLLIEHSAGSMTSQSFAKKINRRNEVAAKAAELISAAADHAGTASYPFGKINAAWDLILGSQMHDILPGTAIPSAYEYAWNDETVAANHLFNATLHGVGAFTATMDTRTAGRSVAVYNPVAAERTDVVSLALDLGCGVKAVTVKAPDGAIVPSQVVANRDGKAEILFLATLPASGIAIYDIAPATVSSAASSLSVTLTTLENEYFKVTLAPNGDIASIYDKQARREVLARPASLEFLYESPKEWPAWNMDWADRQKPAIGLMDKNVTVRIVENGPVRVALEVSRWGMNSHIVQTISLAAGEAGRHIEVANLIDWQSAGVSLKASFPLTVSNRMATYSLDNAAVQRATNDERKFEVPSRQWLDLSDSTGSYGVTILEDGRYGSDKPDASTLRLTLMYTPVANVARFTYQATQDWGIHELRYGIYPHSGAWNADSPWQAKRFNQPLLAYAVPAHEGTAGRQLSLATVSTPQVDIMALKKAEQGEYYIIRLNELTGRPAKGVQLTLLDRIAEAFEVNGQEQRIAQATIRDGKMTTDMGPFAMRSFAVRLDGRQSSAPGQQQLELPCNADVISRNGAWKDGAADPSGATLPAEQLPAQVISEDICFIIADTADGQFNAVECRGQKIALPDNKGGKLWLLAMAETDACGRFTVDGKENLLGVQSWRGFVGQHYAQVIVGDSAHYEMLAIEEPFLKKDNIAWYASHYHTPKGNASYQYCYLYKYGIAIPAGAKELTLPDNPSIKIMAITIAGDNAAAEALQPWSDDPAGYPKFHLRRTQPKPTQAHR